MMNSIDAAVDHVLDVTPGDIVLGIPLGVGKPNPFVNALYHRIKANPARRLKIITALSLEKPVGKSELEQHFLEPLVERVFETIRISNTSRTFAACPQLGEVFRKTETIWAMRWLAKLCPPTTRIARDMEFRKNVMAQVVAGRKSGPSESLQQSDVIVVMEKFRAS
jgi:hypothetical protein